MDRTAEKTEIHRLVEEQYEKYPYPAPQDNLFDFIGKRSFQGGCPSQYFHLYWPFSKINLDIDILVAGCGTMQAPKFAVNLPNARITAIDICDDSIEHTNSLLVKHNITNVTTRKLPIEDAGIIGKTFDLIISTGVLHHLPDPEEGLRALETVLRSDGSMYLMLYGKYGRDGTYYIQDLLRRLGLDASSVTAGELSAIRQFITTLPPYHPLLTKQYFFNNFQVGDEELVDLLLHPKDQGYSIPDIVGYLDNCGMKLQSFLFRAHYAPRCSALNTSPLADRIKQLPETEQFAIGELYRAASLMHFFIACKKERDERTYQIDLDSDDWKSLVPVKNPSLRQDTSNVPAGYQTTMYSPMHQFPNIRCPLLAEHIALFEQVNNYYTIEKIQNSMGADLPDCLNDDFVRDFFRMMHDYDFVSFRRDE